MLNVGLIGCGGIARHMHAPAIAAARDVQCQWVMDSDPAASAALASEFALGRAVERIPAASGPYDAVVITTPPHVRPDLTQAATEAGYHVLAEKPLGNSVADCQRQIAAAASAGKLLAVSHQYRFWPSRRAIKSAIDEQRLGPVRAVTMSQGKPYSWISNTGYTMLKDQVPGGVLINAGIHPLDTMLWWLGDPKEIDYTDDALGGLESNFELKLGFNNGITGRLTQSRTSNLQHEIRVCCRDGDFVLPTYSRSEITVIQDGKKKIEFFGTEDDSLQPSIEQLESFRDAVCNGVSLAVDGLEAMRCVSVIEQCYRAKQQRPLPNLAPIPGALW